MSFFDVLTKTPWDSTRDSIYSKSAEDVERALAKDRLQLEDFKALVSPAALPYLEPMAQKSKERTRKRFGNIIQMYVPMYLSNKCTNICTYCGFSAENKIPRKQLSDKEILGEISVLKKQGYDHILLVMGESTRDAGLDYLIHAVDIIKPYFSHISIEVQPLKDFEYRELMKHGLNTVLLYQETYNEHSYRIHHKAGMKTFFKNRIESAEHVGRSGMFKLGLGSLIGLEDWRTDAFFGGLHLQYLEKAFWKMRFSISFPRLRPYAVMDKNSGLRGLIKPETLMSDREFVQLICAYRLFNENVELSLSTRESQSLRDNLFQLGITSVSAGSKTNPGGYSLDENSLEQFEISDDRKPDLVASAIKSRGYEPVWKDWDNVLS